MSGSGAAMRGLIDGYREFRGGRWALEREKYASLSRNGQTPQTLVIACSDSRCDPSMIFNADPGSLFVLRNVAAIVPPLETDDGHHGTSAAIAFAVLQLKVRNILVMGHAQCGGVDAALNDGVAADTPFLRSWIDLLAPAVTRVTAHTAKAGRHAALEREVVKLSLERLKEFPFVAERLAAGTLELNGAYFGIADGRLEVLDWATGQFTAVA
jgi:carbonic anhydrase